MISPSHACQYMQTHLSAAASGTKLLLAEEARETVKSATAATRRHSFILTKDSRFFRSVKRAFFQNR